MVDASTRPAPRKGELTCAASWWSSPERTAASGRFATRVRPMNDALAHRGPGRRRLLRRLDAPSLGHRRLAIIDRAGGHQPMTNEDGTVLDRLQRRDLQPPRRCATAARGKGHRFRTSLRHRSHPPRLRGVRRRRASSGSRACSRSPSTTAGAASCSPRAIGSARSRSSTRSLDGVLHFASELPALATRPVWHGELDLDGARGLPVARLLPRAGDDLPRRLQARARPLAARRERPRRDAAVLGRHRVRHRRPARRASCSPRSTRRSAPPCTIGSRARCRSARSCQRRHRLGPRRLVHGRGARRPARHDVGRLRRTRAQRARGGRALTAAHFQQPPLRRRDRAAGSTK